MLEYNIYEAKTKLSQIAKILENQNEKEVIIKRNGKPILKITLYEENKRKNLLGCAKGLFTVPDDFDDIDIESDFLNNL